MRLDSLTVHYLEFAIASVLLIINVKSFLFFFLSSGFFVFSALLTFLFLIYAFVYLMKRGELQNKPKLSRQMHVLFIAILVSYFAALAASGGMLISILKTNDVHFLLYFGGIFILFLPVFFLCYAGAYLIKNKKEKLKLACLLFLVAFLLLIFYLILFTTLFTKFLPGGDESLMSFESIRILLNGSDPYTTSIAPLLSASNLGFGLTTNNSIIGIVCYPALFFLSSFPFYFLAGGKLSALKTIFTTPQMIIFTFILLIVFMFLLKKDNHFKPKLTLLFFFALMIYDAFSPEYYLMLAFIFLAYIKIDSKYVWVFLGLCASIQELLWLPVLFLLAYSANNNGIKRGAYNLIGTIIIFLLINGYFIALNPGAYFSAVLAPLNQFLMPQSAPPPAFLLLKYYPILMPTYGQIFDLVSVLLLVSFIYLNKKELIPFFCLIPLMFRVSTFSPYYTFFIFIIFFALQFEDKGIRTGIMEKELKKRKKLFYLILITILVVTVGIVCLSHNTYEKNFSIRVQSQSLNVDRFNKTTVSNVVIVYHNLTNRTINFFVFAFDGREENGIGLVYPHVDYLNLTNNSGEGNFIIKIEWLNTTKPIVCSAVELYNDDYYYTSDVKCIANV